MLRRVIPLALAHFVTGCAPELNWREFTPAESQVQQLFPCRPVRQLRQVDLAGRRRALVMYVCDAGSASWAQVSCPVDGAEDARAVRAALWAGAQANLGAGAPASATDGAASMASGLARIRGSGPDGVARQAALKVVEGSRVVVQAVVMGTSLQDDDVAMFLESVRGIR